MPSSSIKKITLKTFEGEIFKVDEAVVNESKKIKHLIDGKFTEDAISLPNILSETLSKVIEYVKKHADEFGVAADKVPKSDEKSLKAYDAKFMKVDMNTLYDLAMKISNTFTRRYGGGLSNPVFVKPPDGNECEVHWTRQNGEFWFEKGWKEFVENYSLDNGYLVVFKYEGTSQFDVLIFNQIALEIDYPASDTCDEKDNLDQSDDESAKILEEISPEQKARPKSPLFSPRLHKKMRKGTCGNMERSSNLQNLQADDQSDQGTKFQKSIKHQLKEECTKVQRC